MTTFLLAVMVTMGPLFLGGARLWAELPLLCGVALLLVIQGWRLSIKPAGEAEAQYRIDIIDLTVILFVAYAVVRWLTSPAEFFSRIEVMDVVAYAGVFLTCRYGMAYRRYCIYLLFALVIAGVGETALGYFLSEHPESIPFSQMEQLQQHYAPRWMGTYETPNFYACLLVMAIGAALALGSLSKLAWPIRIVLFYLAVMMMVGVIYSGSRGGWIALIGAVFALLYMGIRHGTTRWWVPAGGVLVLILVAGTLFSQSPVVKYRMDESAGLFSGNKLLADDRVRLTEESLRIASEHPLFGTGPGTFAFLQPQYQIGKFETSVDVTHDDYLHCLDDYGIIGLGLALCFVVLVSVKFVGPLIVDNRWQDRVIVTTGFAAWVALVFHSLLDSNFHVPANALVFFSLTGLALGRLKEVRPPHWTVYSLAPLGRWVGACVIGVGLILGARAAQTALGDWPYEKAVAHRDKISPDEGIAAATEALRYDSGNVPALILLGDSHLARASLQNDATAQQEETGKALEAYARALKENPLDQTIRAKIAATAK